MEKIKFKNSRKYKGIVEKVFVKDGEPVTAGQVLAQISTQMEKFQIQSPIDGVVKNIYIIESLIVSHGDIIFDIINKKELNNILKKPENIGDTLKEALTINGFIDKLNLTDTQELTETVDEAKFDIQKDVEHTEEEFSMYNQSSPLAKANEKEKREFVESNESITKQNVIDAESVTRELEGLEHLKFDNGIIVDKEESLKEVEKDFKMSDKHLEDTFKLNKEEQVQQVQEEEDDLENVDLKVFAKPELKPVDNEADFPLPSSLPKNLEVTKTVDIKFEDEKDIAIFEDHNPIVEEAQIIDSVNQSNFLSKFRDLPNEDNDDLISMDNSFEKDGEDLFEKEQKNEEIEVKSEEPQIIEPSPVEETFTQQENKVNEKPIVEKVVETVVEKVVVEEKFDDSELKAEISKLLEEQSKLNEKIAELEKRKVVSENVVSSDVKVSSSIDFEVDITALLHLQTLMYEPYLEKGIEIELNSFYLKAMRLVLAKFTEFDFNENSTISLGKKIEDEFKFKDIKIEQEEAIANIAKQISENATSLSPNNISIWDLSEYNILSSKIQLNSDEIINIAIGDIHSKVKGDMELSNYLNVTVNFDKNIINVNDAVEFAKEFNKIITNPGLLI
ncbi:hypothetical protein SCHIN_v1c09520 [Spiroplasma chinense]|uniref:Lipoyl-binding domain-containing protein n=1 Tax=Spiroplasma chinense TaxID=216932 RepID=A0A5B9Y5P6_9MOLU|nr:biotin/lipoyl-binding protein [Spiroplasma chinense]QEH62145.1 hypothetical protein SCHIN_v1c09520 [Spiroplasma chinense]